MQSKNDQINTLIELNDDLENYFRNTIIPQLFIDAHLILRKFTPPAVKLFNLDLTDVGKPFADIEKNFRFPAIVDNIRFVIDTGEILEKEIQTTNFRWYQMNILPYVIPKENRTNGVIITFVEITMRIKDLKEQEKIIAEHEMLLDTISHNIKNPLMGLSFTIQLLKQIPKKGMNQFPALVANFESSLGSIKDIIDDLIQSRQKQHRYQTVEELLNFEQIVEDVRVALAPQIQESKAVIMCEIGISEIVFIRRKLRTLIYNLISNAIKFRSFERIPEILIKTEEEKGFMVISIIDNGVGIAEKDFKMIFDKYHRLDEFSEDTGIGLYLVKGIATSSGGKITVESEVGKGSVFKLFLKLKPTTAN